MAWIESHQELPGHPKTAKLARLLEIDLPTVLGHLHLLWWWALDYAQDGSLAKYEDADIAAAMRWPGEPQKLINGLLRCGKDGRPGFLERATDGSLVIHDWEDYAGRLLDKRRQNAERMRRSRARHAHVTEQSRVSHAPVTGLPYRTVPNSTVPKIGSSDHPPTPLEGATATTTATAFSKEPTEDEKDLHIAIDFWQHNIGPLGLMKPHELKILKDYQAKGLDGACLRRAMEIAVEAGVLKMNYISKIWQKWVALGVHHIEDIEPLEREDRFRKARGPAVPEEPTPPPKATPEALAFLEEQRRKVNEASAQLVKHQRVVT